MPRGLAATADHGAEEVGDSVAPGSCSCSLPRRLPPPLAQPNVEVSIDAGMSAREIAQAWMHAGVQLFAAIVAAGRGPRIHLVCAEAELPYQRPPASTPQPGPPRCARAWSCRIGTWWWPRALTRRLPDWAEGLSNVAVLRTAADAGRRRERPATMTRLTVGGGGFIGLEVAATARDLGESVDVLESAPRLPMRSVSPELAGHVLQRPRASGIELRLGMALGGFEVEGGRLRARTVDGSRLVCVESVNAPVHHMAARKQIEAHLSPAPEAACGLSGPLRSSV